MNGYDKIVEERNESEQRSYLYSTVKNLCLNFIRNSRPVYMDLSPELMTEFVVVDTHDYMYELIGRLPRNMTRGKSPNKLAWSIIPCGITRKRLTLKYERH